MNEEEKKEERSENKFTNTQVSLNLVNGSDTTQFSFSAPAPRFEKQLNNMLMLVPALRDRLEPMPDVEGVLRTTVIDATFSPYQATLADVLILADATANPITVNLVQALNRGKTVQVIKTDSSGNHISVAPFSGDSIEGSGSFDLAAQYDKCFLYADGVLTWLKLKTTELP